MFSGMRMHLVFLPIYEPQRQKIGLRGFRPGPTQIRLRCLRKWLEAWNFVFRKERDCTIHVAKTKALISFAVTTKLICVFVFAYAKIRFSHVAAHMTSWWHFHNVRWWYVCFVCCNRTSFYLLWTSEMHHFVCVTVTLQPRSEKTGLRGFRPVPTQTKLDNYWRWLGTWNLEFRK